MEIDPVGVGSTQRRPLARDMRSSGHNGHAKVEPGPIVGDFALSSGLGPFNPRLGSCTLSGPIPIRAHFYPVWNRHFLNALPSITVDD